MARGILGEDCKVHLLQAEAVAGLATSARVASCASPLPAGVRRADHQAAELSAAGLPVDVVQGDLADRPTAPVLPLLDDEYEIVVPLVVLGVPCLVLRGRDRLAVEEPAADVLLVAPGRASGAGPAPPAGGAGAARSRWAEKRFAMSTPPPSSCAKAISSSAALRAPRAWRARPHRLVVPKDRIDHLLDVGVGHVRIHGQGDDPPEHLFRLGQAGRLP